MVSTPENGVDSIALTYSLMDPIMTVMRPVAGFVSGIVAGVVENFMQKAPSVAHVPGSGFSRLQSYQSLNMQIGHASKMSMAKAYFHEILRGQQYAFGALLKDVAKWYLLGVLLAGIITALIPNDLLSTMFHEGILSYLAMLIIGLPIYVCATFSTPIAAAMVAKGLSPGAALVFLLAGPATNLATITMLMGLMGKRSVVVYLASIIVCSLGFAYVTDYVYAWLNIKAVSSQNISHTSLVPGWLEMTAAIVMLGLCLRSIFVTESSK